MIKMMELVHCAAKFPFEEAGLQRALSDMDIGGTSIYLALYSAFGSIIFKSDVFAMHICWDLGHAVGQSGTRPYIDHIILYSSSYLLRRLIYKYHKTQ